MFVSAKVSNYNSNQNHKTLYLNSSHKVGKERLRIAESVGLHRKAVTGPEVAEDTDKERKVLQLQACEVSSSIVDVITMSW